MSTTDESNLETAAADQGAAERPKLALNVSVETRSACQRHVTVTIPRDDIERYFQDAFSELVPKAEVPGFRAGRAPRKLVEARFRKDVAEQVKGSLLMDSFAQVTEDQQLSPISDPDFDPRAISVPEDGPMTFEFDIEVRPVFDLPEWRGLTLQRPVKEFGEADIDEKLRSLLAEHGRLVPFEGAAGAGDYVVVNITFLDGEKTITSFKEQTLRIRSSLSFRDGKVEKFDKLMAGVKAGETREGQAQISFDAPNEAFRGKTVRAVFEVLEVKKLELPELTPSLLQQLGDFASEQELRDTILSMLQRRLRFAQQERARAGILQALTIAADWDLPPELLKRQSRRELERRILELRRNGFSEDEIRAHGNELTQNSQATTARALKEHFILEKIAETEGIEDLPEDYDDEIRLIAEQSGESPRRVRAQLEKKNLMDTLRNQIIERKVIDLILSHAKFKDVPYQAEKVESEAIDAVAGGGEESEIPEAQPAGEPSDLEFPRDHG